MSEQVCERSEQKGRENSPSRPGEEPEEPDDEAVIPGDPQNDQERPRSVRNKRVDKTNAPCRRNGLGGHLDEPEASRGVEGVWDREMVVDGARHDGICSSSDGSECRVETNVLCRKVEPGGHMGELKASRDIESDWRCQSKGKGDLRGGRRGEMDGATSGTCGDSKRVDPRPLANQERQHQGFTRNKTVHVPEPSTPPTNDPKHPIHLLNPPCQRGRMKSQPRNVNSAKTRKPTY